MAKNIEARSTLRLAKFAFFGSAATWLVMSIGGEGGYPTLPWVVWSLLVACSLFAASIGITSRSLATRLFAIASAGWVVGYAFFSPWIGSPWLAGELLAGALSAIGVGCSIRSFNTKEARAEFAPIAYRRTLLAGALVAGGIGLSSAAQAICQSAQLLAGESSFAGEVWGPALLGIGYIGAAVGVLRMRAWGPLLAIATAIGAVLCALPVLREAHLLGLFTVCSPGLLLATPLLLARLAKNVGPKVRVAWDGDVSESAAHAAAIIARGEASSDPTADEGLTRASSGHV